MVFTNILDAGSNYVSRRMILIVVAITSFTTAFLVSSINVALPTIGREFAAEAVILGWIATSYVLSAAAFLIPVGRLADIHGRKMIFQYGLIFLALSSFLCAISHSTILLIFFRVLQGFSSAMIIGPATAIITSVFPAKERGRALGIITGATSLGLTMGPYLGGVMTQFLGWRSIFFFIASLFFILAVVVFWKFKGEWTGAKGEKFDIIGSISLILSIVILMYGFSVLPRPIGICFVLTGALGIIGFIRWETKTQSPVFDLSLFRNNPIFAFSNLTILIVYSATMPVSILLSLYLQYIIELSPQTAGLLLITTTVVLTVCSPIAGRLSDKVEPRKIASVGMVFNCIGLLILIFLNEEIALELTIIGLAIFGLGMGLFASPNVNAIMGSVGKQALGTASGTIATMRSSGQMMGMGIIMILFSVYIGDVEITPQYYPAFLTSLKVAFIIFTTFCFVGIFTQLAGRKISR